MHDAVEKFFELSLDLFAVGTISGQLKKISPAWTRVLGWSQEELFKMSVVDLIHPDDAELTLKMAQTALAGGQSVHFENRYRHKDGGWRWLLWTSLFSNDDHLLYGIAKDVTEQKTIEKRLQQSERRLATAQRIANIGSWELDLFNLENVNLNPLSWSDQVFRIFGYQPGEIEVSNENFFKSVHPDDRERIGHAVAEAIRSGQNYDIEHRVVWPDGTERVVHELSQVIVDEKTGRPTSLAGTVQDITEKKALLGQLAATQRIESIGRLTGGIAHDFNNILAAIYGNLELLARELDEGHKGYRYMKNIETTAKRAADLTSRLLTFSRQKVVTPSIQDLNSLVHEGHDILSRILGEDIEIRLTLEEKMGLIEVDASQVIQVILNLAINARDAMPQGGVLNIETMEIKKGSKSFARLKVTDTGHGMDQEILEKIYEPFFTTKSLGNGTGLGLSTVYGIVSACGGSISVASRPGQGTCFEVLIPITDKAVSSRIKNFTQERVASTTGSGQSILLVEDETDLRTILQETLEQSGFRVIAAESGKAGLQMIQERSDQIDLMVTDIVLPGVNGFLLIEKMLELRPELPIICMSGYPSKGSAASFDLSKVTFLPKPFLFHQLLFKVGELLLNPASSPNPEMPG